jgi:hypothetical protein
LTTATTRLSAYIAPFAFFFFETFFWFRLLLPL